LRLALEAAGSVPSAVRYVSGSVSSRPGDGREALVPTQEVVVRALRFPLDIAPNVEVEFLGTFSKNVFKEA
jgi:hypothetical protein